MFDIKSMQEAALYEAVKAERGAAAADQVVYGPDGSSRAESGPAWVTSAMRRLEGAFDGETVRKIRRACQCGYGMEEKLALVRELMETSTGIEEFASSEKARSAGLFCKDGQLFLQFDACPCPMLAGVDRLETDTWCQCTTGYSKVLFERAFSCEADVALLSSIKRGDGRCLMKITLHDPVFP